MLEPKAPRCLRLIGNTENQSPGKRHYCFTLNNPTIEEKETINSSNIIEKAVVQEEVGESGTVHLQGYIMLDKKRRITELKKLFLQRAHYEGANNIKKSIEYCQKKDSKVTNGYEFYKNIKKEIPLTKIKFETLTEKQKTLVNDILEFKSDYRKILFIIDFKGGFGKSYIAKYFYDQVEGSLITNGGKASDINFILKEWIEQKNNLNYIIFDIPRCSADYINYSVMENIFNGLITSAKYESCILRFNPPKTIVCFLNDEPDYEKLSKDRYVCKFVE